MCLIANLSLTLAKVSYTARYVPAYRIKHITKKEVPYMVYVLDIDGQPLMPTSRHRKVRKLLNSHLAKVAKRCPFTIQLLYQSTKETQPVSLGVDAGSRHIGLTATTEQKVVYQEELVPRNDVVKLLSARRALRSSRRSRKTRYRKPRFNNRVLMLAYK